MVSKGGAIKFVSTYIINNMSFLFQKKRLFNQDLPNWRISNIKFDIGL